MILEKLIPTSYPKVELRTQVKSVQFGRSDVSDSLWPQGLQHARPPCPSPTPGVYSNMFIESVMPSNHLILCRPFLLPPAIFPSFTVFSNESNWKHSWCPLTGEWLKNASTSICRPTAQQQKEWTDTVNNLDKPAYSYTEWQKPVLKVSIL